MGEGRRNSCFSDDSDCSNRSRCSFKDDKCKKKKRRSRSCSSERSFKDDKCKKRRSRSCSSERSFKDDKCKKKRSRSCSSERSCCPPPKPCRGDKGKRGPPGCDGSTGPCGPRGRPGKDGKCGKHGDCGKKGKCGPHGDCGPRGPMGKRGCDGSRGERGRTGCEGPVGPTGCQGKRGCEGEQGERGCIGPRGKAGCDGRHGKHGKHGRHGRDACSNIRVVCSGRCISLTKKDCVVVVTSDCSVDIILPFKDCNDDCCDEPTKTQVIKVKNAGSCPVFVKPARGNNIHGDCDDKIVLRCGENTEVANCGSTWYVIDGRD